MKRRHYEHWRHRRHDFRLQRVLFWWFGITILFTCAVSFGVMRLASSDDSWRKDTERLQAFAAGRFAKVWDDAEARRELMQAVAGAFDAGVELHDAQGQLLESEGGGCRGDSAISIPVQRDGRRLGSVEGCFLGSHGLRWTTLLPTLFAAFLCIWGATAKLSHALTRPLRDLTRVTREIGAGKLESRVRLGHHHRGEVGILAESINDMAKRIERQLNDQRELLAGVSHEIRSPLARLRVLAELLQGGTPAPDLYAKMEQEVAEIDELVGKLLASSRLDFGALDLQTLRARDLALRALERAGLPETLLHDSAHSANVRGDATLLARALGNLLENAQHHAGGPERLTLRADQNNVYIEVADSGPGLSASTLDHGFDPFFRGSDDGQQSSRGALGLGLSLVRRIARAHGGEASLENRRDAPGALASIQLPRAQSSAPAHS